MGDSVIITREQLTAALQGTSVKHPVAVAEQLFDEFAAEMKRRFTGPPVILPQTSPGDPELEALDVIVVELARLAVLGEDAVARVVRYVCERYMT